MDKPFFVMLSHPSQAPVIMVHHDEACSDNVAYYESEEEAREAAIKSFLGEDCGFEVFELGPGW